jgi:hypothetical protein
MGSWRTLKESLPLLLKQLMPFTLMMFFALSLRHFPSVMLHVEGRAHFAARQLRSFAELDYVFGDWLSDAR